MHEEATEEDDDEEAVEEDDNEEAAEEDDDEEAVEDDDDEAVEDDDEEEAKATHKDWTSTTAPSVSQVAVPANHRGSHGGR